MFASLVPQLKGSVGFGLPLPITVGISVSAKTSSTDEKSGAQGGSKSTKDIKRKTATKQIKIKNESGKRMCRKYTLSRMYDTATSKVEMKVHRQYKGESAPVEETVTGEIFQRTFKQDILTPEDLDAGAGMDLRTFGDALKENPLAREVVEDIDRNWLLLCTLQPEAFVRKVLLNKKVCSLCH